MTDVYKIGHSNSVTHPILSHPKWTRVHPKKKNPLFAVAIAMDVAPMCLSCIVQWVVDMSDGWREAEMVQFLTHAVLYCQ